MLAERASVHAHAHPRAHTPCTQTLWRADLCNSLQQSSLSNKDPLNLLVLSLRSVTTESKTPDPLVLTRPSPEPTGAGSVCQVSGPNWVKDTGHYCSSFKPSDGNCAPLERPIVSFFVYRILPIFAAFTIFKVTPQNWAAGTVIEPLCCFRISRPSKRFPFVNPIRLMRRWKLYIIGAQSRDWGFCQMHNTDNPGSHCFYMLCQLCQNLVVFSNKFRQNSGTEVNTH